MEKQTNEGNQLFTDTIKSLIPISKQSLLRDIDVVFNTRMAYDSKFFDGEHTLSNFNVNQLRFEVKGKIHDKVYFRFRNRYTREPIPGNLDNISRSVDLAFVRIDLSPRTNFSFGKLCADWGGWEFDFNPIDILAYNDIIEYADNFLVGAGISHTLSDEKNSFSFQILNSRTKTYEEQYGSTAPPNLNPSEYPLAAVVNWRGNFFDGKFETTYSYSFFNEAKGAHMNYFALGNKFKAKNLLLYYDFQYSDEGLDRKGIISGIISNQYQYAAQNTLYVENWIRAEYLVNPKINLLLTVMTSNASWKDNPDPNGSSKLSTSYGLIPTIQYMPFKDFNMKFYLGYVARKYNYTGYAETTFGAKDYTTGLLSFGIIAPLLVL
ncbi:OprO/OprP family phosphate-selective porin [Flavobacterium sp. N3904]|uniref:OprO/OprP family phosphate-selective porin n=1 Tax=Flavobacterium sp. N3904 TaxID=2986835 RepID=UPI0022244F72|nr:OprO/OprP family phosphate-selective porin [Flavobacterium sp. N3904]